MPTFSTPSGTAQRYIPALNRNAPDSIPGTKKIYATHEAFEQGVADERACIGMGLPVWYDGIDVQVETEPLGVLRRWRLATGEGTPVANAEASHGRTVVIGVFSKMLISDGNRVLITSGPPGSGDGSDDDLALDSAAGVVYEKTDGLWVVLAVLGGAGGEGPEPEIPETVTEVADPATSMLRMDEVLVHRQISVQDFISAIGEAPSSLPSAAALADSNVVTLSQDGGASQVRTTLGALKVYFGGAPATPTITVTTPAGQVAGTPFTLAGTYQNGTPTALDFSLDGGSTWTAAASPTITGGNYSFSLTIAVTNASQVVRVRDHDAQAVIGVSSAFAVTAAPVLALTVTTPSAKVVGTAFTLTGTYANFTPTALDYSLDGGATWVAAVTPTIGAGAYSFSLTISAANASQVVRVRDHTQTTVAGTSGAFVVAAAPVGDVWAASLFQSSDWPADQTSTASYIVGSIRAVIKKKSDSTAPPIGLGINMMWSKSSSTPPTAYSAVGTQVNNANDRKVMTRTGGWTDETPGNANYGLYSPENTLYAWGGAGTYFCWIIMSDGTSWTIKNGDGSPRQMVLS